jgi:hypothetical protein
VGRRQVGTETFSPFQRIRELETVVWRLGMAVSDPSFRTTAEDRLKALAGHGLLVAGMNGATVKPQGWLYLQWHNPTFQDFHNAIIDDTWTFDLPLAAGVNPRDSVNGSYYLPNWASVPPSSTYGHYIAIRGYSGLYSDPTRYAYYNDSSGGVDEVTGQVILGSTGSYSYGSYGVWETMLNNYQNLIW